MLIIYFMINGTADGYLIHLSSYRLTPVDKHVQIYIYLQVYHKATHLHKHIYLRSPDYTLSPPPEFSQHVLSCLHNTYMVTSRIRCNSDRHDIQKDKDRSATIVSNLKHFSISKISRLYHIT